MKITRIEAFPYNLKYTESFTTSFTTDALTQAKHVFIKIYTDEDLVGFGYSSPSVIWAGESQASAFDLITNAFAPRLIGGDPFDIDKLMDRVDRSVHGNFRAKAGIDLALHDLIGKKLNVPLYKVFGGCYHADIPIRRAVGLKKAEEMAIDALRLIEKGYKFLKLKIGTNPRDDVGRVKAVREAVGHEINLAADANQAYSPKTAIHVIKEIEKFNVEIVEQPVPAHDIDGLAKVTNSVDALIEADESVITSNDVLTMIQKRAVDMINLKVQKMGGILNTRKIAILCERSNMKFTVGSTPGSKFSDAASAHFIASSKEIELPCEVGESERMTNDPVEGIEVINGCLRVPQGPGLGIRLNLP